MQTTMTRAVYFPGCFPRRSAGALSCSALCRVQPSLADTTGPEMTFKLWISTFICLMGECGGDSSTDFYQRTEMEAMQRGRPCSQSLN